MDNQRCREFSSFWTRALVIASSLEKPYLITPVYLARGCAIGLGPLFPDGSTEGQRVISCIRRAWLPIFLSFGIFDCPWWPVWDSVNKSCMVDMATFLHSRCTTVRSVIQFDNSSATRTKFKRSQSKAQPWSEPYVCVYEWYAAVAAWD